MLLIYLSWLIIIFRSIGDLQLDEEAYTFNEKYIVNGSRQKKKCIYYTLFQYFGYIKCMKFVLKKYKCFIVDRSKKIK